MYVNAIEEKYFRFRELYHTGTHSPLRNLWPFISLSVLPASKTYRKAIFPHPIFDLNFGTRKLISLFIPILLTYTSRFAADG